MPLPAAQGLVVLSFATIPAALDRLAEIVATGPVAVEMLDRMILDLAAENPLYARHLNFAEGRPAAVLAAQFYADSASRAGRPRRGPGAAVRGPARRPGRPQEPDDADKDDFWKVRKAGFSLLMGMVGDAKPVAFVEDTAVDPRGSPSSTTGSGAIVAPHGVRGGVLRPRRRRLPAHPADHQRQDRGEGVETLRSIAREVSDLVVEFGGAMSGEHGDGLARSLWNRKLFGPEVYAGVREPSSAPSTPRTCSTPARSSATPTPATTSGSAPTTTRTSPSRPSSTSRGRGDSPGPSRCARASAPAARPTAARCARATWSPATRCTRPAAAPTPSAWSCPGNCPPDGGSTTRRLHEALDLCLQCKACKTECPSNVDMAKLKAEVLHQHYQGRPRPLGHLLMGQIFRLNPIASAIGPAGQLDAPQQPAFKWLLEKVAGIDRRRTPADVRPRPSPQLVPPPPARPPRRDARAVSSCSTTASRPTTPRGRPRGGAGARGGGLPRRAGRAWPAAAGRRSRRASCRWPATWPAANVREAAAGRAGRASRSSAASRAAC